ncbi:MAG: transposase [Kiritimatiellia bacterium]
MACLTKLYFGWSAFFNELWPGDIKRSTPNTELLQLYESEGVSPLSGQAAEQQLQMLIELSPDCTPQFLTQRLKGRMNHWLRKTFNEFPGFDRSFFLRTLGQNTKSIVAKYIQSQVEDSDLVDPLYRERLNTLRFHDVDKRIVSGKHRGFYDLFVHLVLISGNRYRMHFQEAKQVFSALRDACEDLGACPYDISMMPDHAHLLVRWPADLSANELVDKVKAGSGKKLGRLAFWSDGGYVGTVGPYRLSVAMEKNRLNGWVR